MSEPVPETPPLATRLMQGTLWTVGMRWGVRILGIISMVVLVRILSAEDFGLIAMAMAVVALADRLTDFGIIWALVRDKNAAEPELNTAWTVRQAQLAFVAIVAVAAAPLAANAYDDPRVADILYLVALSFLIRGFENIGIVEFQRQLDFHKDFVYRVLVKLLGVITSIGLAVWLRNYWALAWGMVATAAIGTVVSYIVSPYRPRWTFERWKKLWSFSQWILSQGIARYFYEKGPILVLGRLTDAGSVGYYTVSSEIAALPASEVAMPVSKAVFPGFAKLRDEQERLRRGYLKALGAVATVTIPLGLGIAVVAEEIVYLILGAQWAPAIALLQIFAIFATFRALDSLTGNLLMVLDRVRQFSIIAWVQAAVVGIGIIPAANTLGLEGVALLKALGSLVGLGLLTAVVASAAIASWKDVLLVLTPPAIAGAVMTVVVILISYLAPANGDMPTLALAAGLAAKAGAGAITYAVVIAVLWFVRGKPDGLEAKLMSILRKSGANA